MNRTWKLLPLAALAALGLFMLVPGVGQIGVPAAHASITAVADAPDPITAGGTSVITITATEPGNAIALVAGLPNGSLGTITTATCAMLVAGGTACTTFTHTPFGTYSLTISAADDGTPDGTVVVIQATFQSTVPTTVGYTASQAGGSDKSGTITVNASGSPDLTATAGAALTATAAALTLTPTLTPTATSTVTTAITQITVSATSPINCGGSSFVTAILKNANGVAVPGTVATLSTNLGTISPTSAIDQGGGILAVLTAPTNQGGTATITVSAGGVSGSATVQVNCAAPTSVPPTATTAPQTSAISPPRTGDAGLLDGRPAWRLATGFALIAAALLGSLAVIRQRA